jgi:queuosine precursor transporter
MLILLYLGAFATANIAINEFGPSAVPIVSFLLVGFIITTRDVLHERWTGDGLVWRMAALVAGGGALSVALNIEALPIAIASMVAFTASETANALVYHPMLQREVPFLARVNLGNVVNAVVDSVLFVTLAFGFLLPIIALQVAAKILGGALWSSVYAASRAVLARRT